MARCRCGGPTDPFTRYLTKTYKVNVIGFLVSTSITVAAVTIIYDVFLKDSANNLKQWLFGPTA